MFSWVLAEEREEDRDCLELFAVSVLRYIGLLKGLNPI